MQRGPAEHTTYEEELEPGHICMCHTIREGGEEGAPHANSPAMHNTGRKTDRQTVKQTGSLTDSRTHRFGAALAQPAATGQASL